MAIVKLGARSYREGKVFHFDPQSLTYSDGNPSWANGWEAMSLAGAKPRHAAGWRGRHRQFDHAAPLSTAGRGLMAWTRPVERVRGESLTCAESSSE
jgi:hypothetical protein